MTKFLFVTDLDNTLVGDDEALLKLNPLLSQHRQEHGTRIVYATGRSHSSYHQLKAEKPLIDPDALITSVGTEIYDNDGQDTPNPDWSSKLSEGWDRDMIVETAGQYPDLIPQVESEQRPFKVSYHLTEEAALRVLPQLDSELQGRGVNFKLIYSGGKDLDILPSNSDKGLAVEFLRQQWGIESERTVVCGDSGNDIALFSVGFSRGIIVGNARPELRQWYENNSADYHYLAKANCAGGIIEGLNYFSFLSCN